MSLWTQNSRCRHGASQVSGEDDTLLEELREKSQESDNSESEHSNAQDLCEEYLKKKKKSLNLKIKKQKSRGDKFSQVACSLKELKRSQLLSIFIFIFSLCLIPI